MPKHRFSLFNAMFGETVALVELDEELLKPDAGVIDHDTMTLRPIRNGGTYTLLPIEDHTISVLRTVRASYQALTETPAKLLSDYTSRIDGLIDAVRLLFNKVSYVVIESPEDLDKVINPPNDYEPKKVEYDALGRIQAMLDESYDDSERVLLDTPEDAHQDPPE